MISGREKEKYFEKKVLTRVFCSGYKGFMVVLSKTKVLTVITRHLSNLFNQVTSSRGLLSLEGSEE